MFVKKLGSGQGKGWFTGPWDSDVPIAVGYADHGVHEPHAHDTMFEIYLVRSGSATAIVASEAVDLRAGDVLVVEPGEVHTFTASTPDYAHFVIQAPFVAGDKRLAST